MYDAPDEEEAGEDLEEGGWEGGADESCLFVFLERRKKKLMNVFAGCMLFLKCNVEM